MSKKKDKKSEGRPAPLPVSSKGQGSPQPPAWMLRPHECDGAVHIHPAGPRSTTPWILAIASWVGLAVMAVIWQLNINHAKNGVIECMTRSNQLDAQFQAEQLRCKFYKQMYNECVAPVGEARR